MMAYKWIAETILVCNVKSNNLICITQFFLIISQLCAFLDYICNKIYNYKYSIESIIINILHFMHAY